MTHATETPITDAIKAAAYAKYPELDTSNRLAYYMEIAELYGQQCAEFEIRLAAAEAELRQIKSSETVAWLMEGSYGKFVYQHNAIADYRELDKNSTVTEIIRRPK